MALLPTPGAIPTAVSRSSRRAPPEFTGWDDDTEAAVPEDLTAFAASLKGTLPVPDAEEIGFFSNVGSNILRNAGEVGVGLMNVVGADEAAKDFRDWADSIHGYKEQFSLDDVINAWDEGRYAGVVKNILGFTVEHGVGSLPWWLGAINPATMVGAAASMTGLIAEERAKNNGRENITFEDIYEAAPAGIASVLSQKVGLSAVMGRGIGAAAPAASKLGVARKAGVTGAVVSAEEAAQETIEELGATVGTEAGVSTEGLKRAALSGALAGGPLGAVGGAVTGTMDVRRIRQAAIPSDEGQAIEEAQAPAPAPVAPVQAVPTDEAQAVAEAKAPAQAPQLAETPGVRPEESVTDKDITDLQAKAQRSTTEVNDAVKAHTEGKLDPVTFNGVAGPNLFDLGLKLGYSNPQAPYSEFKQGFSNYLKSQGNFKEQESKPASEYLTPQPITPEIPRVPAPEPVVQATLTEVLPEPGPVSGLEPKPLAEKKKPKRKPKAKVEDKGPPMTAVRERAGELGVDARGSKKAILERITAREEELAAREQAIGAATFESFRGTVGALESRAEGEGYSVAESTLREGTETLRYLAAKPEMDRGKGRKRTTKLTKPEEGRRKAEAQLTERRTEDARSLELLHAELSMAPTPEAQLDVLNRAAPILERHSSEVSTPGDDLVGKLKAIRTKLVEQRPEEKQKTEKERARTAAKAEAATKAEAEQPKPKPMPVVKKKRKYTKAEAVREFVGATEAIVSPNVEERSAAAVREEASTLADQVLITNEENKRIMAPQLAGSGASPETLSELRLATSRLVGMAKAHQAKSKVLEQTARVRELLSRVAKEAESPRRQRAAREDPDASLRRTAEEAELDALMAEQETERELGGVIEQEIDRFSPEEMAMLTYRDGLVSEQPDMYRGLRAPTPEQNQQFAQNLNQQISGNRVFSVNGLLDAFDNAQLGVPGRASGFVPALRPLMGILRRMNLSDVNVVLDPDLSSNGQYDHSTHTVSLNANLLGSRPYAFYRAAMHELVHAATARQMFASDKLAQQVEAIREYTQSILAPQASNPDFITNQTYGFLDAYEFLAEGLSNPVFQQQLNDIVLPVRLRSTKRFRSVWDNLVDLVRRTLGLRPRTHSALEELLRASSHMLTSDRYRQANQLRKRHRPSQLPLGVLDETGRRTGFTPLEVSRQAVSNLIDPPGATLTDRAKGYANRKRLQAALWAVPRDVVVKTFRRYFVDPLTGRNPLEDLTNHIRDTAGTYHLRWGRDAALIRTLNEMTGSKGTNNRQARQMRAMYRMAVEATMGGVHPDKAWSDPENIGATTAAGREQGREALHQRLEAEWNRLDQAVQDQYHAMQEKLKDTYFELRRETLRFQGRIEGIDNAYALARIGNMQSLDELNQIVIDHDLSATTANRIAEAFEAYSRQVAGPYFPLRRMGDYVAYGTKDLGKMFSTPAEAEQYINEMRNEYPGATLYTDPNNTNKVLGKATYMSQVDSLKEAESLQAELRDLGFQEVGAGLKREEELPANTPLHDLLRVAQEKGHDPAVISAMRESLMALLPEARMLRSSLRRENVEGASVNMLQSFAQHLTASHRAIAHLQHSHEIQAAYSAAEKLISAKEKTDPGTAEKMRLVIQELHDRQASAQEGQEIGKFDVLHRRIGQLAFARFLLDASYLVLNSTQTLFVTFPQLAGQYGARKAIKAMAQAYADTTPRMFRSIKGGGAKALVDPSTLLEDVKRDLRQSTTLSVTDRKVLEDLFERAQQQGVLNSLQSEEMVSIGRGESKFDRFMRAASGPAQYVEFMNRLVTLHAAYNLARSNKTSVEQSIEDAIVHTRETHFDYSVENRPRWSHHGFGRLFGVFKMHAMGMMFRLGDYTMKLTRPADRGEGIRQLMYMMATTGAVAGALGSIMSEPIRWALWMMGLVFDDEDDVTGFLDDPDIAIRQMTHDWLGEENDEVAAWITDGLLPSVGSRVSLGSLFFRDVPDATQSAQDIYEKSIMGIAGAPGAYAIDITKSIAHMQEGEWNKAFQKMVPVKALANLSRAYDMNTKGITDRNGNLLVSEDQFGFWHVAGQAIGFTPAKKQQVYMAREVKYKREKAAQQRATVLRQRYYRADREDRRGVWEEIRAFNRKNPAERITRGSLQKGLQRRRTQERQTVRGVYFHGRQRQRYYNEQTEFSTLE